MATQQIPGLTRIDLQQHDLSVPGREVIQNRVEIDPDAPPNAAELATYVVEKGKPLLDLAE
jgi:hypothetical protein